MKRYCLLDLTAAAVVLAAALLYYYGHDFIYGLIVDGAASLVQMAGTHP
jgi:hypothetical protein